MIHGADISYAPKV